MSALLLLSVASFSQTEQGSFYISGVSSMTFARTTSSLTNDGTYVIDASVDMNTFRLLTELGVFIIKDLALGLAVNYSYMKDFALSGVPEVTKEILFMPCLLYIVPLNSPLRPYVQVGGGLATLTQSVSNNSESFSGYALAGVVGVKYFINATFALDFGVQLSKTEASAGANDLEVSGESLAAGLGISVYF